MTNPDEPAYAHTAMEMKESALQAGREPKEIHYRGLTKREYFAAMAMKVLWDQVPNNTSVLVKPESLAATAIRMADALIAELNKEAKP